MQKASEKQKNNTVDVCMKLLYSAGHVTVCTVQWYRLGAYTVTVLYCTVASKQNSTVTHRMCETAQLTRKHRITWLNLLCISVLNTTYCTVILYCTCTYSTVQKQRSL